MAIDILNDLYFYGIDKGEDVALKDLQVGWLRLTRFIFLWLFKCKFLKKQRANKIFDEWVSIIKQSTVVFSR
jgi:hypothetical protein